MGLLSALVDWGRVTDLWA